MNTGRAGGMLSVCFGLCVLVRFPWNLWFFCLRIVCVCVCVCVCVLECVCVERVDVCVSIVSVTVCIRLRYEDVVFGGKFPVNRHLSSAAVLEGLRNGRKAIPNVIKAEQNIAAEIYHTHA